MANKAAQIRAAIKTALLNQTDAGSRVYMNRARPTWQEELPILLVYTNSEEVTVHQVSNPFTYKRTMNLSVEIALEADEDIDDDLDAVGEQVEYVLYQDHSLGELVEDTRLIGTEFSIDKDGDNLLGSLKLTFEVIYYSVAARDFEALTFLNKADIHYDLDGLPSGDSAHDILDNLSGE